MSESISALPSRVQLPVGAWATVLEALVARFPTISAAEWQSRFAQGLIRTAHGVPLTADTAFSAGLQVEYFRAVPVEAAIPFHETVLHQDEELVVVDKPHFLPVVPSGPHVRETLLHRLVVALGNPALTPLHRLDRDTAGLVLFSANVATRDAYQKLFRERRIDKRYECRAPALPDCRFPLVHQSRLAAGTPFFRMQEVPGTPNSETRIETLRTPASGPWHYALAPLTGRKHQLRVHMAALGAPIANDDRYPDVRHRSAGDYQNPLQLLARALQFDDPVTGASRRFESRLQLQGG